VGSGALMFEIEHIVRSVPHTGLELVGYMTSNDLGDKGPSGLRYLGDESRLASLLSWYKVDVVILALDATDDMSESDIVPLLYQSKKIFVTASHLIETLTGLIPYELFSNDFLLGLAYQLQQKPYLRLKRLLDIIFASTLLILSLPIAVSTALALFIYGGPSNIFFFQTRVGKNRRPFLMYKFRSMRTKKDGDMAITRIGRWIRKFRIDEIPQLINIIKGDMSLIGPRPETDFFSDLCQKHIPLYRVMGELKPGLTGWAQIKLSHVTSLKDYKAKFSYNLYYLKNLSLALDLEIVMSTIRIVLLGKGK
jgi:lipopolysaccharide/colanic/teichoic acid biosynthesis glycosyltransferase